MNGVNYNGLKAKQHTNIHGRTHQNVRKNTRHYEELQKLLDAYQTKHSSVEFRNNVLRRQKKHNYQLEYDRIRGILSQSNIPHTTRQMLIKESKY
jgi:hypothetical protein